MQDTVWPKLDRIKGFDDRYNLKQFEDYADRLNLLMDVSYQPVFTSLILNELRQLDAPMVLDIGCGKGIGGYMEYTRMVANHSGQLWGLEPDESISDQAGLFTQYHPCLLEEAPLPDNTFDIAYAVFVLEHVRDPEHFFSTIYRLLKPGGSFLAITPNASALFGRTSRILNRLKIDELVLRLLKGKEVVESYHYPLASRCNSPKQLRDVARRAELLEPEMLYFQFAGTEGYFPGPFLLCYKLLMANRKLFNKPSSLDSMICRITKPG